MSAYRKAYDYASKKRFSIFPLWYQRFHHRHPSAWMWTSFLGMFVFLYHKSLILELKRFTMTDEEYKAHVAEIMYLRDMRVKYGEGIRIPFTSSTVNIIDDREIELMKAKDRRKKEREEKLLAEEDD